MKIPIEFSLLHFLHLPFPPQPPTTKTVHMLVGNSLAQATSALSATWLAIFWQLLPQKQIELKNKNREAKKHNMAWAIKNARVKRAKWNKKTLLPLPLPRPRPLPEPCHCQLWHPLVVIVVGNFCLLPLAFTVILTTSNVCVCVCVCVVCIWKSVACFWARSKLAKPKYFAADLLSSMSASKFDSSQWHKHALAHTHAHTHKYTYAHTRRQTHAHTPRHRRSKKLVRNWDEAAAS